MATCQLFLAMGIPIPQNLRTMYVVRMINATEMQYAPKPYAGTIALFRGRGLYEDDPNMGWDGLAETLENYEVGDGGLRSRRDIMNEPLVGLLAQQLSRCIVNGDLSKQEQTGSGKNRAAAAVPVSGSGS
jgi:hypothetical protein